MKSSRFKNSTPDGLKSGEFASLTRHEKEVLYLLTEEFLTVKKIALLRKTSVQAVYKIIRKLKKKGVDIIGLKKVENFKPTRHNFKPSARLIRLHGQEFNIKILYKDGYYGKLLERCNTISINGNTIRLYQNSIEVYSAQSFYGENAQSATIKSFKYWNKFFNLLENDLKIIVVKARSQNVKLVNQHYAEINNELAEKAIERKEKIRVYTTDDGKLWFEIDDSWDLKEAETIHPETAKHDMEDVVAPFFNDLRDKKHIPLSKLSQFMADTSFQVNEISHGLKTLISFMESQLPKKSNNSVHEERPDYFG